MWTRKLLSMMLIVVTATACSIVEEWKPATRGGGGGAGGDSEGGTSPRAERRRARVEATAEVAAETAVVVEPTSTLRLTPYLVGETANLNGLQIRVNDVQVSTGGKLFAPERGRQFVILDMTLSNDTGSALLFSPAQQMTLLDVDARVYRPDVRATRSTDLPSLDRVIPTGSTVVGGVGYQVPIGVEGLQLHVSESMNAAEATDELLENPLPTPVTPPDPFVTPDPYVTPDPLATPENILDSFATPESMRDPVAIFDLSLIVVAGSLASPAPSSTTGQSGSTAEDSAPEIIYPVGQAIDLNGVVISVDEVLTSSEDETFRPSAGKQFIIISTTITNTTGGALWLAPEQQMVVSDDQGNMYRVDARATASTELPRLPSSVAASATVHGAVGYHIPSDAAELRWTFTDASGAASLVFDLTREAEASPLGDESAREPSTQSTDATAGPFEVDRELEVGQTADLEDLRVTVDELRVITENEVYELRPGNRFLLIKVTLVNTSSRNITVSSAVQMVMRGGAGRDVGIDAVGTALLAEEGLTPDGPIAPGETLVGWVGYQVPADEDEGQWVFKDVEGNPLVAFNIRPR